MPRIDFKIKRNDTSPEFVVDLTAAGVAADLSDALSATFHMSKSTLPKVSAAAVIEDQELHLGRVKYVWVDEDTDTVGVYKAEFEIDFGGGVIQTYPNDGYLYVQVVRDLA